MIYINIPKSHSSKSKSLRTHNFFYFCFVGNLPNVKKKTQNNVGWAGQPLSVIIEVATQFFENSLQENNKNKELK